MQNTTKNLVCKQLSCERHCEARNNCLFLAGILAICPQIALKNAPCSSICKLTRKAAAGGAVWAPTYVGASSPRGGCRAAVNDHPRSESRTELLLAHKKAAPKGDLMLFYLVWIIVDFLYYLCYIEIVGAILLITRSRQKRDFRFL